MSEAIGRTDSARPEDARVARVTDGVLVVREGHGANCSSIGSVIDTLFATAVIGGAVLAAVAAALTREEVRVVGERRDDDGRPPRTGSDEKDPSP